VTFTSEVNRVIFSVIVIVIALFIPGGVMGMIDRWRRRRRRVGWETRPQPADD
jgi:hypothetical protein